MIESNRLVELNHVLVAGMTTFPGLPGPEITPHLTREASRDLYAPGTEFAIDRISMVGNTGTYADSPIHRFPDGADLADMPLSAFADVPIVVCRTTANAIGPEAFTSLEVHGAAVLVHTGWDRHFGTDAYGINAPHLTAEAAEHLVRAGARVVGIDAVNVDAMGVRGERPCHTILLRAGIPILEHLTGLDQLPETGARLHAAPLRIRGFSSFPVRAYAIVPA